MGGMQAVAKQDLNRILQDSIEKQCHLVLTRHCPQGWRTFKSKFVSGSAISQVMLVKTPTPCDESISQLPEPGDPLGATFRSGHKKCMFNTTLLEREAPTAHAVERDARESIVALRWPDQIQQLQRRVYQRATPPDNLVIPVRLYPAEPPAAGSLPGQPQPTDPAAPRRGQLEDLSAGGMRVKVADVNGFQIGSTYRCVFAPHPGKPSLVVEALVRHRQAVDHGRASIGFQFLGLEVTPESRRLLQRLARAVTHFQRAGSRSRP